MNPSAEFEQEQALFARCLEHPPEEWEGLLATHCDDAALRERVRRLLQHHVDTSSQDSGFLRLDGRELDRIGPYRILRRLGEGGMGIVYAAEQREPVRRRVAVKVLRAGYSSREVLARFEVERQALALMSHPSIARILDAGTTADHRPFIVMEFVPGETITQYCEQRELPLKERLLLFCDVCDAIQHAHQRGIIHRDLKPSNILIMEEDGRALPKVIDFGIAKATTVRLTDQTLETRIGSLLGTPDYMSPEQADLSPLDIDTRTDVYALGAVLYHLLTGRPPLQLAGSGKSYAEMQQVIRDHAPQPPSSRISGALQRQVRGELDWITLKALEKQRAQRYASPAELASDIRRHLANETIIAGPPSRLRNVRKFARRHWLAVSAVAAVMLTLSISQVQLLEKNRELQAERDRANAEADNAKQVTDVLAEIVGAVDPDQRSAEELTVTNLLRQGYRRVADDASLGPAVRFRLLSVLGAAFMDQGDFESAASALRLAVQAAREGNVGPAEHALQTARLATALLQTGDVAGTEQQMNEAEALIVDAGLEGTLTATAVKNARATYYLYLDHEEAIPLLGSVAADYRRQLGPLHERTLSTEFNLGNALARAARFEEAREQLDGVILHATQAFGPDHSLIADASLLLGNVARRQGDLSAARDYYTQAGDAFVRTRGADSGAALSARMGLALTYRGQPEGIDILRDTHASSTGRFGADAMLTLTIAINLADQLNIAGRHDEAMARIEPAYRALQQRLGTQHAYTREAAYAFAAAAANLGRHEDAVAALETALHDRTSLERYASDAAFAAYRERIDYREAAGKAAGEATGKAAGR